MSRRSSLLRVLYTFMGSLPLACSGTGATGTDGGTGGGGGDRGSVQIFVVSEDTIPEGLEPGTGEENIKDGWRVSYERFLVTIGNFKASRSDAEGTLEDRNVHVLDLKNAPTSGYALVDFKDVAAVNWDKFQFSLPNAKAGAKLVAPTKQADLDLMVKEGYSVYFEGSAEKGPDKITFKWGFRAGTAFADCATPNGKPGFAVPRGGTTQIKPTIHGDHWFFTNVTQGAELTERRAEWMKLCDKDTNKELTIAELKACDAASALPQKPGGPYDLTGVKDRDGDQKITVYDYVESQARTLGDYQGDGECPTRTPVD